MPRPGFPGEFPQPAHSTLAQLSVVTREEWCGDRDVQREGGKEGEIETEKKKKAPKQEIYTPVLQ